MKHSAMIRGKNLRPRVWVPAAAALFFLVVTAESQSQERKDSEWNQWRGPKRDGLSPDTGLLKEWPEGGPPLAWKATGLGGGFSSVSMAGTSIYTMGDFDDSCKLVAVNATDGKILWSTKVGKIGGGGGYPGPRCTPASDGKLVFGLGQFGDLVCVEAASGKERWRKHMKQDFGGKMMSQWGFSESPLLDGDRLVCTPGGKDGTVLALKKETGDKIWQSEELTDEASYASLIWAEIGGVRQYIVFTGASVAGIAADSGKVLWRAARKGPTAVAPTPIYHDNLVFVTSGYNAGCHAFKVTSAEAKFSVEQVYAGKQFQVHHGGAIRVGEHVYALDDRGRMKCIEFKTGKEVWNDRSVGKGSIAYADGHFVVRSENPATGTIALVEASPEEYKEKGRFNQPGLSGSQTWQQPVIFGGKLYIRDQDALLCFNVKAK